METRRSFFRTLAAATAGACLAPRTSNALSPANTWISVGKIEGFPLNSTQVLFNEPVIIRHAEDGFKAWSSLCTHMQCPVLWNETSRCFECGCHGSVFDSEGRVVNGPAEAPLPSLHVKTEGGMLWVRKEALPD